MPSRLLALPTVRLALVGVVLAVGGRVEAQAVVRVDTLALAPGADAQLPEGTVPGTVRVEVFDGAAFVALPPEAFAVSPDGRLTLTRPPDTRAAGLVVLRVTRRALPAVFVARGRLPPADSLRAADAARGADTLSAPVAVAAPAGTAGVGVQTRGSITRGVVAGTARDAAVTSGLRLELSGEVAPGVRLRGALTDENTPVLPEGTTQQLADLDRVFVEIESARVQARLGDVDLAWPGSTFAPLARQVQGAVVEARLPAVGAVGGGRVLGIGSATRGVFRTQEVVPVEGVQGPYRLAGRAGEAFVVVVPGSERVAWDGQTLVRGQAADYVVDYATGEITFTPRRLVTRERRITVDFEYTTGGVGRTLLGGGGEIGLWPGATRTARATLGVRILREADASSSLTDLGLSPDDRAAIAAAGAGQALVPGWELVAFDAASPFVLYTPRDPVGPGAVPVFVPATAASAEVYRVRFTRVEPGRGDYRRGVQAQNGIVYEYVGPGRGDAIPFRLLPRPSARTLADVRLALAPARGVEAWLEGAASRDDVNTLSRQDDAAGAAWEGGARLAETPLAGGRLDASVRALVRADAFRALDRIRDVDFARRWNLARAGTAVGAGLDTLGERTAEGRLAWARDGLARVEAEAGALALGGVDARRLGASLILGTPGASGPGGLPWLDARVDAASTQGASALAAALGTGAYDRQSLRLGRTVGSWAPTLAAERERRIQRGPAPDSLSAAGALAPSYRWAAVRPGLAVASQGYSAEATAEWRAEAEPLAAPDDLVDAARVVTVEAAARAAPGGSTSAEARVAYRRRRWRDAFRQAGREDAESVAVQLVARAAPLRRAIEAQLVYDALTERTPVAQETYLLVGPDLGEFVWRDGAGEPRAGEPDGVAQVDEFFPETTPLEGVYLRTFLPGQELLPTVGVGLGLRLGLRPGRLATGDGAAARAWRALAFRTVVDVNEQTRHPDVLGVLLLQPSALQQGGARGTVRGRLRLEQEVVLFPESPARGARLVADHLRTATQLAAGRETRLGQTLRAEAYGTAGSLAARVEVGWERRRTVSESFASRTFDLRGARASARLTWTPSPAVAATVSAWGAERTDVLAPPGRPTGAWLARLPADVRWTLSRRAALVARVEPSYVRLRGAATGGLALFELTDGRGPGTSVLWGLDAQVGLSERLRATLVYDGRAPQGAPVVQTVRVQISAVF